MRFGLGRDGLAESVRADLDESVRSEKTASRRQEHQKEAALPPPPLRDPPRRVTCGSSSSGVADLPGLSATGSGSGKYRRPPAAFLEGAPREHSLGLPQPERPQTFHPRTRQPAPALEIRDAKIPVPDQRNNDFTLSDIRRPHPDMNLACCHAAQCGRYRNTCKSANGNSYHSCCRMCFKGNRIRERDSNGAIHWRYHTRECDTRQMAYLWHEVGLRTLLDQRLQETKRLAVLAQRSNSGWHSFSCARKNAFCSLADTLSTA